MLALALRALADDVDAGTVAVDVTDDAVRLGGEARLPRGLRATVPFRGGVMLAAHCRHGSVHAMAVHGLHELERAVRARGVE